MLRPEERFRNLLVGFFAPELREGRADVSPMLSHLVTGDAGERVPCEHAGTIGGTRSLSLRLGRKRRDDGRIVGHDTGRSRRRFGCCGGSLPGLHTGQCPRILAVELRGHPLEPHEVVTEPILGVELRVVEDSKRPLESTLLDNLEQLHVLLAGADRRDLQAAGLAVGKHPVEIEHLEIRLHPLEELAESPGMDMAMMLVVDDADIRDRGVTGTQRFNDLDLILRLAEPATVVVEADGAADLVGRLGYGADPRRFGCHAGFLLVVIGRRPPAPTHPQARLHAVALEDTEDQLRLVIELARKPPSDKLDPLLRNGPHLVVELRNMLGPVVVGVLDDSQPPHHRRAVGRRPGLVVEGDDAPGDEIVPSEELFSRHELVRRGRRRPSHGKRKENNKETGRTDDADHGIPPKVN